MTLKLKTLQEFVKEQVDKREALPSAHFWPARAYVKERYFEDLYVRFSQRHINKTIYVGVLDIANVSVLPAKRSKGVFTNLVIGLRKQYPELPIFVESVLSPRFAQKLKSLGFEQVHSGSEIADSLSPNFFLPPRKEIIKRGASNEVAKSKVQKAPLLSDT